MHTTEQKRGAILEKRLMLLNKFIVLNSEGGTDSFAKFLRREGIKKENFIDGLPPSLQSPPAGGIEAINDYTEYMNRIYFGQYLGHAKKTGSDISADGLVAEPGDDTWSGGDGTNYSLTAAERKAKRKARRLARKAAKEAAGKEPGDKKAMHVLNKLNPVFVSMRAAYLSLVRINMFGMATSLAKMKADADQSFWKKVQTKWYNMGGIKNILSTNVDKGKNKPQHLVRKSKQADGGEDFGAADPFTVGAWITAAGTAIGIIAPIIKDFKKNKGLPEDKGDEEMTQLPPDPDDDPAKDDKPEGKDNGEGMGTKMKWIIGGSIGAALLVTAIILFTRKK